MHHRNSVFVVLFVFVSLVLAHSSNNVALGFASIQTVITAEQPGGKQHMQSGIIVRIFSEEGGREVFTLSNEAGVAMVPLRPGNYCFDAFDIKGISLNLDKKQSRCFPIRAGETIEVGVAVDKHK